MRLSQLRQVESLESDISNDTKAKGVDNKGVSGDNNGDDNTASNPAAGKKGSKETFQCKT
jgi:hypothetical protein